MPLLHPLSGASVSLPPCTIRSFTDFVIRSVLHDASHILCDIVNTEVRRFHVELRRNFSRSDQTILPVVCDASGTLFCRWVRNGSALPHCHQILHLGGRGCVWCVCACLCVVYNK